MMKLFVAPNRGAHVQCMPALCTDLYLLQYLLPFHILHHFGIVHNLTTVICCWLVVTSHENLGVDKRLRNVNNEEINAYTTVQAEDYSFTSGGATYNDCGSTTVGGIGNDGFLRFDHVDFGTVGATSLLFRYSNVDSSSQLFIVNVYLDSYESGTQIARFTTDSTMDWCKFKEILVPLTASPKGVHNVYFYFSFESITSGGIDFDWFTFNL
ncbi:hypothetical protein CHUAL_001754 [Chamberlinius hualienensis]